jgi:hypothetical protein
MTHTFVVETPEAHEVQGGISSLLRHRNAPMPGTLLTVSPEDATDPALLAEATTALDLRPQQVT